MRAEAGYSLVELLIVLALLGLISLAIGSGVSFGARAWERTEQTVSAGERARGGHALLRALLANAYPRKAGEAGAEPKVAFDGTRDRMTFLAATSAALGEAGIAHVTLTANRAADGTTLSLVSRGETGLAQERREIVLTGAAEVSFAYAEIVDGALSWTDAWQSRPAMPVLIRIRARGATGWPDLIVRPRVDRGASCIFDPVSFECRNG